MHEYSQFNSTLFELGQVFGRLDWDSAGSQSPASGMLAGRVLFRQTSVLLRSPHIKQLQAVLFPRKVGHGRGKPCFSMLFKRYDTPGQEVNLITYIYMLLTDLHVEDILLSGHLRTMFKMVLDC